MKLRVLVSAISLSCAALMWSIPAALAATTTFVAFLNGANDGNNSPGTGTAIVVLDQEAAQTTLQITATFSGLTTPTNAAHIHCCQTQPGIGNVGVATTIPTFPPISGFPGFPLGVTFGTFSSGLYDLSQPLIYNPAFVTAQGGIPQAEAALIAGLFSGSTYFNIHTDMFPGGEIRGQLNAVPLPATLPLFATGLGALGLLAWRRKRKVLA
jgi:hypothetical protein